VSAAETAEDGDPPDRWPQLAIVAIGVLLAFAPWFSASAVAPLLAAEWQTTRLDLPLLTVAVQLGFAAGALILAASGAADALPGQKLFALGAVVAAVGNLGFAVAADGPTVAIAWRFATGFGLAAVYPIALKMLASWFRRSRGLAIGVVIGALTVGSALPHLLRALGQTAGANWHVTVAAASAVAIVGAVLVAIAARPGPFEPSPSRFSVTVAGRAFREPSVRLANLGYLGHMWELYAMWTWLPLFIAASFAASGATDPGRASLVSFAVVSVGGLGCVLAGALADRLGRTTLTIAAMAGSGTSAIAMGALFGAEPYVVTLVSLGWGLTVVADSAQFSAAVSELAPTGTAGSALSLQLAAGFVLTTITIVGIGLLDPTDRETWRLAFGLLAIGPAVGIVAMWRLRERPEATKMASGHR
jgi:MFS family permease